MSLYSTCFSHLTFSIFSVSFIYQHHPHSVCALYPNYQSFLLLTHWYRHSSHPPLSICPQGTPVIPSLFIIILIFIIINSSALRLIQLCNLYIIVRFSTVVNFTRFNVLIALFDYLSHPVSCCVLYICSRKTKRRTTNSQFSRARYRFIGLYQQPGVFYSVYYI